MPWALLIVSMWGTIMAVDLMETVTPGRGSFWLSETVPMSVPVWLS